MKRVGIVIVTYSFDPAHLYRSVRSWHDLKWYVHHHGSAAMINDIRKAFTSARKVDFRFHCANRGLARSWNDGIVQSLADGNDVTLVVNDDVAFLDHGFDRFIDYINQAGDFGLAFVHGEEMLDGRLQQFSQEFACFAIGKAAVDKIGAFDETFVPAYFEDNDYRVRCTLAEVPICRCGDVLIRHERSQTAKNPQVRAQLAVCFEKNRAYMLRKWNVDERWDAESLKAAYHHPFNDSRYGCKIDWSRRADPYPREPRAPK